MRLYLMRHGKAEDVARQGQSDAARALTAAGVREMSAAGRGLAALGVTVQAIATSPLLRARQTADAVAATGSYLMAVRYACLTRSRAVSWLRTCLMSCVRSRLQLR